MQAEIIELLDGANFAQLASVNAGGSPHVDTVWIAYEDGLILVATTQHTRKAINLRSNPAAYLVVTQRDDAYVQAQIKLTCIGFFAVCDRIAHKYTGRPFPQRHHRGRVALQLRIGSAALSPRHGSTRADQRRCTGSLGWACRWRWGSRSLYAHPSRPR